MLRASTDKEPRQDYKALLKTEETKKKGREEERGEERERQREKKRRKVGPKFLDWNVPWFSMHACQCLLM